MARWRRFLVQHIFLAVRITRTTTRQRCAIVCRRPRGAPPSARRRHTVLRTAIPTPRPPPRPPPAVATQPPAAARRASPRRAARGARRRCRPAPHRPRRSRTGVSGEPSTSSRVVGGGSVVVQGSFDLQREAVPSRAAPSLYICIYIYICIHIYIYIDVYDLTSRRVDSSSFFVSLCVKVGR